MHIKIIYNSKLKDNPIFKKIKKQAKDLKRHLIKDKILNRQRTQEKVIIFSLAIKYKLKLQ